ncbi:MAG: SOS response-associated peptidase [Cyclobacteriaceae bacterium]
MIIRYSICRSREVIAKRFGMKVDGHYKPNFNAVCKDKLPIITNDKPDELQFFQWGIVPYDSVDPLIAEKLINARTETVFVKKPYSELIQSKRCLILCDGFYIWEKGRNTPYRMSLKNNELFTVAGIWDKWEDEYDENKFFNTFSMLTVEAASDSKHINERIPAILQPDMEKKWFQKNFSTHMDNLFIAPEKLDLYKVSNEITDPKNNHSRLILPIEKRVDKDGGLSLF